MKKFLYCTTLFFMSTTCISSFFAYSIKNTSDYYLECSKKNVDNSLKSI